MSVKRENGTAFPDAADRVNGYDAVQNTASVYLVDAPAGIDRTFDYFVPEDIRESVDTGSFVLLPFGASNKKQLAVVSGLCYSPDCTALKPVFAPVCEGLKLTGEQLELCAFMRERTLCTFGDAVRTVVPASALSHMKEYYSYSGEPEDMNSLEPQRQLVLRYLKMKKNPVPLKNLLTDLGEAARAPLYALKRAGYAGYEERLDSGIAPKKRDILYLGVTTDEAEALCSENGGLKGKRQREALRLIAENGSADAASLREEYGIQRSHLKPLIESGTIALETVEEYRDPYTDALKTLPPPDENVLSGEQAAAAAALTALYRSDTAKAALLYGVTGSGKTRIIKAMTDEVIKSGRGVIILVPEIALTPQTVGFFKAYYRERIAVIHSRLSAGERCDAWRRIRAGEADVCIGTRSAVFAPFEKLGMIVIDEEQEHTYKSDMSPKYHARDIARFRCAKHNALMLLSSATPSVESFYKAKEGVYTLIELKERYGGAVLPEGVIADMRADTESGRLSPIGTELKERLKTALEKGEQAILFINRRGYNRFLTCPSCGNVIMCPHCSVSMTYHTIPNTSSGCLYCHYCGCREPVPQKCPSCGAEKLRYVGFGTQKAEEELKKLFPEARVMRMDADTARGKFAYDEMLSSFRNGDADILIGTQMVTKGHDFPNVTLVGILDADSMLYLDDFRAYERTFSLITQVMGRAGRADKPGCALIQTYNPTHPVIKLACAQDYPRFYEGEIAMRRALVFPPFCDIASVTLSCGAENELNTAASMLAARLNELLKTDYSDVSLVSFGPLEAPVYKLNEVYRLYFVIKCRLNVRTRQLLSALLSELERKIGRKVLISADVNPSSL